jgi:hypothetical protein
MIKLTVYLGSSGYARDIYKNAATDLGARIAQNDYHLVYGGMDAGLMGKLAQSTLDHGGTVTGIVPRKIKDSERILGNLTSTLLVEELCDRKRLMFEEADAVIALPGGFGTLDESLEVLYWGNLGLHSKPIVFVNIDNYWTELLSYIKTLPDFDPAYLITVDTIEDIFPALENWSKIPHIETPSHMPHFEDEIMRATNEPIIIDIPTIENTYFAVCALGLKQLGKHTRHIGFLNQDGEFNGLLDWFKRAAKETFITDKCLGLFDSAKDEETLRAQLKSQPEISIDLHKDKWGESQT